MAEFLLELLSEETPEISQVFGTEILMQFLLKGITEKSVHTRQTPIKQYSTPRRLIVSFNVADKSDDKTEKRKGPRIDAPQKALDGFLRSCEKKKEELLIEEDEKGKFYVDEIIVKGQPAEEIMAEILQDLISTFPWPKSMLWGEGDLRWVRPLHSILAILDGKKIDFEVGGVKSGNTTLGLFNDTTPIKVNSFDDYCAKLDKAGVMYDHWKRREKIGEDARILCKKQHPELVLKLVEDQLLIEEISGLVESPFCLMGAIDNEFLDLPTEVLQTSMRTHQKFLSVKNFRKKITHFITVANKHNPSKSAQKTILAGNQKVLSARLADAKFFWENDKRIADDGMKTWEAQLQKITFHNKLGTQADRVNRIAEFAKAHADFFGVNAERAETTAKIMKLDLCSDMVKEFPELQGIMGEYYAKQAGYNAEITLACKEHYAPLGLRDTTPEMPMSIALAIADKLDTLAGFWAVGIIPTSSKDPFALRRAALGVIRIILHNNLRLSLTDLLDTAFKPFKSEDPEAQEKLMDFFHERLKIYMSQNPNNISGDTVDACRFGQGETDFTLLHKRAKALKHFRKTDDCKNLLQGFKRAHNILHAEQKKDGVFYEMPPEPQYFQDPTETELHTALNAAEHALPPLMEKEQFAQMLQTLANLRAPIDAFFTQVQVNSDQQAVRRNRLCLLHKLCSVMKTFADFSRLNG